MAEYLVDPDDPEEYRRVMLERQFVFYCAVGAMGFLVDAAVLWLILHFTEMGPLVARLLSYLGAATTTWMLHRHLTFPAARRHRKVRQWFAFVIVNGAGALLNYGIYALLVLYVGFFGDHPVAAVAVGSAIAFVVNFWANKTWVFRASPG